MSRNFDGAGDWLDRAAAFHTTFPFSIAVWFRMDTAPSQDAGEWTIWQQLQSGTIWTHGRLDDAAGSVGAFQSGLRDDGGFSGNVITTNLVADTDWHHGFLARASGDHEIILDGDTGSKGTSSETGADITGHDDGWIGGFGTGSSPDTDFWDGDMAWFVIWGGARLTETEAVELANGRHPMTVRPSDIVHAFPLWGEHSAEINLAADNSSAGLALNGTMASVIEGPPMELWTPGRRVFPVLDVVVAGGSTGTLAADMLLPTAAFTGKQENIGVMAASMLLPTSASTGTQDNIGVMGAAMLIPTSATTGTQTNTGVMAANMLVPTSATTGVQTFTGTLAATMLVPTANFSGVSTPAGTMAATMLLPTASFTGTQTNIGVMAASMLLPTSSTTGTQTNTGVLGATMLLPTSSIAGVQTFTGTLAATMLLPTASFTGVSTGDRNGTMAASMLLPTASFTGAQTNTGVLAATMLLPQVAAFGAQTTPVPRRFRVDIDMEGKEIYDAIAVYFGEKDVDGTWRFIFDGGSNLLVQRRESSTYVTKQTWTP